MEAGDWITLVAVIVALGLGVASILHTQSMQKRERKERLLNEIIEWAIDITKCVPSETISLAARTGAATIDTDRINIERIAFMYITIDERSAYMADIADSVFGENVYNAVKIVADNLNKFKSVLEEYLYDKATAEMVAKIQVKLYESAGILIKETAKIKTGDIG